MSPKTILIIEDDHDTRVSLRECFEVEGFRVETAANGREALDLLGKIPQPAIILTDINMPIMNGNDFITEAKKNPHTASIPVVTISAIRQPPRSDVVLALSKPLDIDKMLSEVNRIVTG